jgi:hypothetical protein
MVLVVGVDAKGCGVYLWDIERKMEDPQVGIKPAKCHWY